jgi:putrescine transport system ATP-binding protein
VGETAAIALRPERIAIGAEAAGINRISGRIEALAYHGGASVFRVALPNGTLMQVTRPNLVDEAGNALIIGAPVTLSWSPQATTLIEP